MSETSLLFNFLKGRDTASPHMATVGNNALAMAARLKSSSSLAGLGMTTLISGIAGASAEVIAFTDAIAPMAGLLAALPAVAFAGAASLGVLAIGLKGIYKATALAGTKAGEEAYAKLPQISKDLVDQLKALAPAFKSVKEATAVGLLTGVSKDIRDLAKIYIPVLRSQLPAVASGWNQAFRGTAALFKTPGFIKDMNTSLANTAKFSQAAGGAMAPFLDGLRQIGTVGSAFLPRMGAWLRDIAVSFDAWAMRARNSGQINKWITDGIAVAKTFGTILGNIGRAIGNIFNAGNAGPGFLDLLAKGTATFAAWTGSVKGQTTLHDFFSGLRDLAKELWGIFKSLAGALVQSGPTISTITGTFSLLGAVVKILADNMGLVNAVLPTLLILFVGYKTVVTSMWLATLLWNAAVVAAKVGLIALGLILRLTPFGLVLTAIALIVGAFVLLWNKSAAFRDFWKGVWKDIQIIVTIAAGLIAQAWNNIGDALRWVYNHTIGPIIDAIMWAIHGVETALHNISNVAPGGNTSIANRKAVLAGGSMHHYASGGTVPGPTGSPQLAVVHGGETITPAGRGGGGGNNYYTINVNVAPGANPGEAGRQAVAVIQAYERANGRRWRTP